MSEFDVWRRTTRWLSDNRWQIICANPPGGTAGHYQRCRIPRKDARGGDEVDITAYRNGVLALFECKSKLSHSLRENARSECDKDKLARILRTNPFEQLRLFLNFAHGIEIHPQGVAIGCLAVEECDQTVPSDIVIVLSTRVSGVDVLNRAELFE
jgi:hypothetical protein